MPFSTATSFFIFYQCLPFFLNRLFFTKKLIWYKNFSIPSTRILHFLQHFFKTENSSFTMKISHCFYEKLRIFSKVAIFLKNFPYEHSLETFLFQKNSSSSTKCFLFFYENLPFSSVFQANFLNPILFTIIYYCIQKIVNFCGPQIFHFERQSFNFEGNFSVLTYLHL